jgi:DNA-directed RNA polymerase subunit H (RpoH/RPB5)
MSVVYPPAKIYENLQTFFTYRLLDLVSGSLIVEKGKVKSKSKSWLNNAELMETIQFHGYVIVEAQDAQSRKRKLKTTIASARKLPVRTLIILFDDTDRFTKTDPYKKLVEKLPHVSQSARDYNLDIITISRHEPNVFLRKAIGNIESPGNANNGYIHIYSYKYVTFRNINPLHVNSPKCRVVSDNEEKEIIATLHIDKSQMARVFDSDGCVIWLPAEIGDVIEELHASESIGYEKIYKLVVPTPQVEK